MYVQERGGKYRFFETYVDPRTRQRKTVSVTLDRDTVKSRKHAQGLLNDLIREKTAQADEPSAMTLEALSAAYIAYQKTHVEPQTVIGDEKALKAVKDILGPKTKISTIDARYISRKLDETHETPTRKNYRLKHIKKLFRWAYRYDYIQDGAWIAKLAKYKDNERERRQNKYLEADELLAVLGAMTIPKYKRLTRFLALTGLRIGEALAMTADDIDLEKRTITVNKALSLVTLEIGTPKTETSNRTIHIQEELLPLAEEILPDCFKGIEYRAYTKYLNRITLKVVGRSLSPHSLRHTHISLLAAQGVPLDVISHRCGHSDSDVTREIYLHVTQAMKNRDAAIIDPIHLL